MGIDDDDDDYIQLIPPTPPPPHPPSFFLSFSFLILSFHYHDDVWCILWPVVAAAAATATPSASIYWYQIQLFSFIYRSNRLRRGGGGGGEIHSTQQHINFRIYSNLTDTSNSSKTSLFWPLQHYSKLSDRISIPTKAIFGCSILSSRISLVVSLTNVETTTKNVVRTTTPCLLWCDYFIVAWGWFVLYY